MMIILFRLSGKGSILNMGCSAIKLCYRGTNFTITSNIARLRKRSYGIYDRICDTGPYIALAFSSDIILNNTRCGGG